jgi:ribosomal protein S21
MLTDNAHITPPAGHTHFDADSLTEALRRMKKELLRSGFFRQLKDRAHFTPPGEARRIKSQRQRKIERRRARRQDAHDAARENDKRPVHSSLMRRLPRD